MRKYIDEHIDELYRAYCELATNGAKENYQKYARVIQIFLDKCGWRYSGGYDDSGVHFIYGLSTYGGLVGSFNCELVVDSRMLKTRTISSHVSMEDGNNVEEIMEFITRANMQLNFGAFKLDFDANQILFDIALPVEIIEILDANQFLFDIVLPVDQIIEREGELDTLEEVNLVLLLTYGARMFRYYRDDFITMIRGELTPEEAISNKSF